ncbi:MAG: TerB family tellurite resistance protein [Proteobacteria bacterium]|nr:TerB family tellurite resistance protein [Pseudomonadota bacterium]
MGYWGKILGGFAGFAMGGPFGAVVGATLGHAADSSGAVPRGRFNPAQLAALFGRKEQLFSISVVVLSAKLAKCDGPVTREEIDAFKRQFRIPPSQLRDVGRLFDEARDRADGYEQYAAQLGQAFADSKVTLSGALAALFAIARADGPINKAELMFLSRVHAAFGLDQAAWDEARGGTTNRMAVTRTEDAYAVLGVGRDASDAEIRNAWKKLVRENHPDSLAARGVPADFVALATEKVAEINAAWDSIKRERRL